MEKPISQVHITPPSCEHGEGYIIANRAGLRRLLVTIERALACGVSRTVVYAGDGEGYDLFVALSEEGLSSDSPPYLEGPRKEGRLPYERVRKELARRGLHTPVLVDDADVKDGSAVTFDLIGHLYRQRAFSSRTFGPGARTNGVLDHIRKELRKIEAIPKDLGEWIDVVLLALGGAWRSRHSPESVNF